MVYSCKECDATFTVYSTYYSHKKTKHEEACIKCKHCDIKFKTIHARNSHYYQALAYKPKEELKEEKTELTSDEKVESTVIPTLKPCGYVPSVLTSPSVSSVSKLSYRLFDL